MNRAPWVRRDLVLILLALALCLPRLSSAWSAALRTNVPSEKAQAAVGYARERLWSEFLRERAATFAGLSLPDPTLLEYRQYLSGLGLKRRGDASTLVVLPVLSESRMSRQIEVVLAQTHPPLLLKLYLPEGTSVSAPVGSLEILVDSEGVVSCMAAPESTPELFSYWPLRPSPLLP